MANLESTIDLIFNGIDNASDTAATVGSSLKGLNDAVSGITSPLADFAGKVAIAQAALIGLSTVIGAMAYKESVEFESSLLDLQKQMEDGEGSAKDLAKALEALAMRYGTNANELVKSAADFKAAGYDVKTSVDLVNQSLNLMIAGGVSAASATDILNKTLAGFQIDTNVAVEAQHIGDLLNKAADLTKSSFPEIAQGFADLSPIARLTGLTMEETVAILTKVIDTFGSGAEAANGLKSGFLSLIDPSKEAAAQMQAMGVKFTQAGKPIGDIKAIIETLSPAFAAMDNSQKLMAASTLFGKEQAGKMVEALGKYNDAMTLAARLTKEAGGSIDREVTIKLASAEAAINSTNEAFRQLLRALGDQFSINTTGAIRGLGELGASFKTVIESGSLEPLFAKLRPQLEAVETLFKTVAKNIPAAFDGLNFDALVKSLDNLGIKAKGALEALLGPIDIQTVDGLREALQRVLDLVTGLINVTAGELGGLEPFLKGIRELALTFKDASPATQGLLGNLLGLSVGYQAVTDTVGNAALVFLAFGDKLKAIPALLTAFGAELRVIGNLAAGGSIAAGLGAAGIAGAVGLLAFELTRLSGLDNVLNDVLAPDAVFGKGASLGTVIADLAERLGLMGEAAQKPAVPISELSRELDRNIRASIESRKEIDSWMDAQEAAAKIPADTTKELEKLTAAYAAAGYQYDATTGQIRVMADAEYQRNLALSDSREAFLAAQRDQTGYVGSVKDGVVTYTQWGNALSGAKKSSEDLAETLKTKTAKEIIESTKAANDFQAKMEQIASNERIKNIEAAVSIKVAGLEADAKRVQAVFASIDNSVSSTGDLIGSLFDSMDSAKGGWERTKIEGQIDLENKRRQEALDIQKKLAEAEIERINAQTASLNRGDALIKIEGDGLKPELEAFMWKILSLIRVRANAEFSEYLLGVAS